ncbi:hypothetical protein [Paenibacillus koleovorans]|uniref:hypothetical protein n=1 Tax=Paenibacillus koleovorans TaxID=121608 RepID=UPI000FDBBEF2|nr:hypothetical protein [Paenibacillus koleovorans]
MKRKSLIVLLLASLLCGMFALGTASAADMLISNYSFESGTTGWTQSWGSGGITVSTEQAYSGTHSVKVVDSSATAPLGLESNYMSATAGSTYIAYARHYIASGEASIYLRFWTSTKTLISGSYYYSTATAPVNDWGTLKVKATAPANTAYVTVLIFSHTPNVGTAYYDDILITKDWTNIGVQMTIENVRGATFGKDVHGSDVIYAVIDGAVGTDAKLVALSINPMTAGSVFNLPGAEGAWNATTATDGKIYVGSYTNGRLYQYTPGQGSVVDLGQGISGQVFIWDVAPGAGGSIYGATGNGGVKFFKYTPGVGKQQIGTTFTGESIMKSIRHDPTNNVSYLGVGAHANLIRYNHSTGTSSNILPAAYSGEQYVYYLDFTGGKLFPLMYPSYEMPVLNVTPAGVTTVDYTISGVNSLGVSPERAGDVYYTKAGVLHKYNIAAKSETNLGLTTPFTPREFGWVQLNDQTTYPGYTLVMIGNTAGKVAMFQYNLQSGLTRFAEITVPSAPTTIESIARGADNKIYSSGYLNGGTGVYTTMRSDLNTPTLRGVGQAEGITSLNGKLYYGVYPDAKIMEHDPLAPWTMPSGSNPVELFRLSGHNQDRPFGMASGGGKLFIGTAPKNGYLNGSLTVYNPSTGTHTYYDNIASNRSVIALAYHSSTGILYGGTSVSGGNGAIPTQTEAKLLKFNPANGTSSLINLPTTNLKAITAVTVGPDNNIWMMAGGRLLIYNPTTSAFVHNSDLFSDVVYNPTAASVVLRDASLVTHPDGNVYGVIQNARLFKINGSTKAMTLLSSTNGGVGITLDEFNNLMYFKGIYLMRYAF